MTRSFTMVEVFNQAVFTGWRLIARALYEDRQPEWVILGDFNAKKTAMDTVDALYTDGIREGLTLEDMAAAYLALKAPVPAWKPYAELPKTFFYG